MCGLCAAAVGRMTPPVLLVWCAPAAGLLVFLPSLVAFVALDVTWISLVAGRIYKEVLGDLLRPTPDIPSGVLAWLCIVGAVQLFALTSAKTHLAALQQASWDGLTCLAAV